MGPFLVCLTRMSRQVAVLSGSGHLCACYVVRACTRTGLWLLSRVARIAAEPDPAASFLRSRLSIRPPDPDGDGAYVNGAPFGGQPRSRGSRHRQLRAG
jgi:hypothetical protein